MLSFSCSQLENAFAENGENVNVVSVAFSSGSIVVNTTLNSTDQTVSATTISNTVANVTGVMSGTVAVTQGGFTELHTTLIPTGVVISVTLNCKPRRFSPTS